MTAEVALFGGSFDPPHVGHVLAVAYVLSTHPFDRVMVIPVFAHAFDKPLSPFEHRVAMARLAMADLRRVDVSTVEQALPVPSRTVTTLEHLHQAHAGERFRLVIGADVLADTERWHEFGRIQELAPPFVLGRAGIEHPDAPPALLPEVSSTHVRELLRKAARPCAGHPELAPLVPHAVLRYIDQHGLYR